jgi:hypothetical protein
MKWFGVREFLIVSLEKMFPSQETSFQRSSLLDFGTMEPIQRKEVSYWPLIYKGQGTSSSLFGNGASNLVEAWVGKRRMSSELDMAKNSMIQYIPQQGIFFPRWNTGRCATPTFSLCKSEFSTSCVASPNPDYQY